MTTSLEHPALGSATVIQGDARHIPLDDSSVDLIVTSPPYFALRSYQDDGRHYDGQLGSEPTPAEFVAALLEVTRECVRVLKPSGSLWVNLGDKYAQSASQWQGSRRGQRGILAGTKADEAQRWGASEDWTDAPSMGARPKSLIGIPWRYALACIDDLGLILRAEVIWSKPNGLPESVTDRVRRSHEQWFHFTLEPRYFSAVDEIREAYEPDSAARRLKYGNASRGGGYAEGDRNDASRGGPMGFADATNANPLGKLPGSVWTIPTEPLHVPDHLGIDHFAAFPTEWPKRIIRGWSPAGVCVECGEGLVPVVAKEGGRPVARAHRHLPGYSDPAGEGRRDQSYRIEGYRCACPPCPPPASAPTSIASARTTAPSTPTTPASLAAAADGSPALTRDATVPTRPAVILDPFGGTGTTATVAKALGRHGITLDMSSDYSRLAQWRTNDPDQLRKILDIPRPTTPTDPTHDTLF